ncbi:MAG: hypothetical protein Fur0010_01710 [Bdellovibrio sp.]
MDRPFSRFLIDGEWFEFTRPSTAKIIYKNKTHDVLRDQESPSSLPDIESYLSDIHLNNEEQKIRVFHFFYEYGYHHILRDDLIKEEYPLLIILEYEKVDHFSKKRSSKDIQLKSSMQIDFATYERAFRRGLEHLERGDCYQYNLTFPELFSFEDQNIENFFQSMLGHPEKWGAYAHMTNLPMQKIAFLSNSPESLFEISNREDCLIIESRPIKGTYKISDFKNEDVAFEALVNSEKNQAELFMIIDLLRNDLYKIAQTHVDVIDLKKRLDVPGIVHQMGVLQTQVPKHINLLQIMQALFPGGSITGAPKKRVMEILSDIEKSPRGFYCGSTVLFFKNIVRSSINIRSATLDFANKTLSLGAGGGITHLSSCQHEFEERKAKLMSFLEFFSVRS